MAIEAYPLAWPQGWKRIPSHARKIAQFGKSSTTHSGMSSWRTKKDLTLSDGLERVLGELQRMGVRRDDIIVSTNVTVRLDGLPRSGQKKPLDPGVAVYWPQARGAATMRCMAVDRYTEVADNLAAVAATLEALRAVERHGGGEILERAFTGFKALAAENEGPSWWATLDVDANATEEQINTAYRAKARFAHPDVEGGSDDAIRTLNIARDQAIAAVRGRTA